MAEPLLLDNRLRADALPAGDHRVRKHSGADKIIYGGYSPFGVSMERSFRELENLGFREHIWGTFLRDNAVRVFKLDP